MRGLRGGIRGWFVLAVVALAFSVPVTALAGLPTAGLLDVVDEDDEDDDDCGLLGIGCLLTTTTTTTTSTTTTTTSTAATTTTTTTTTTLPATTTTTRPVTTTTQPPGSTPPDEGGGDPGGTAGTPLSTGLGGVDMTGMSSSMAGAVEMLRRSTADMPNEMLEMDGLGMMAEGVYDFLSPVLPPALADAVSSPFVIVDALFGALTSSGQALIVPAIALLFGFGTPGIRRRLGADH